jgi:hypothetical protein
MSDSLLHIFGPEAHHDESFIAGNREALVALRNAVELALISGVSTLSGYVNDGEGFELYVMCASDKEMDNLAVPYSTDYARENREEATYPHALYKLLKARAVK